MTPEEAALTVIETITQMASEQRPLMARVLPAEDVHFWKHYPDKDARDAKTKSRWYYHVHAPGQRDANEHGHFHLFLHRDQLIKGSQVAVMPPEGEKAKAHVTHLVALSVDTSGIPMSWFTTNRFVTNEFLYPAETMIKHLKLYNVDKTQEDELVNRLVTAMVALYREEIAELLRQRDVRQAELVAEHGSKGYEKDCGVEVLSSIPIDLDEKISALDLD